MAITSHERVGKALGLLQEGLAPFIEREFTSAFRAQAQEQVIGYLRDELMWFSWNHVFKQVLGHAERSLASE